VEIGMREQCPALVDEDEASFYLTVSPDALRSWRRAGTGPRHVRLGRRVKYRIADLDRWISENCHPKATTVSGASKEAAPGITEEDITFLSSEQ
jgi:hypothetical protein